MISLDSMTDADVWDAAQTAEDNGLDLFDLTAYQLRFDRRAAWRTVVWVEYLKNKGQVLTAEKLAQIERQYGAEPDKFATET